MTNKANRLQSPTQKNNILYRWLSSIIVLILLIWVFLGIPAFEIKEQSGTIMRSILDGLIHPDWSYVYILEGEDLLRGLLETFAIAVISTFLSAIFCIPLAFIAAKNMVKSNPLSVCLPSNTVSLAVGVTSCSGCKFLSFYLKT